MMNLRLTRSKLWTLKDPSSLYVGVTIACRASRVVDRYNDAIWCAHHQWDAETGLSVQRRARVICGACVCTTIWALWARRQSARGRSGKSQILQEMGTNAIRTAHNPPAPELLDLCDRMGILVMDEFADTWTHAKKPNGYARLFDDWAEKDVRAMVRRDRNHPCVILWSTGNEIGEQSGRPARFGKPRRLSDRHCSRRRPNATGHSR